MVKTNKTRHVKVVIIMLISMLVMSGLVSCEKKAQKQKKVPPPQQQTKPQPAPVAELTQEDFKLMTSWPQGVGEQDVMLEEDMLQPNYYIIFDGSGSMKGEKLSVAKKALSEFVNHIPANANVGLAVFDQSRLSERAVLGETKESITEQIKKVSAKGKTPLKSAISLAYQKLVEQGLKQLGYGEYHLVVVTDGEASEGQEPTQVVNKILGASPVVIHTIGFQIGTDHSLNQPGKILYTAANNFEELRKGLESVLAELDDFSVSDFQE
jgi:uncharacterized protein YegL